jgi:hypothetical protein
MRVPGCIIVEAKRSIVAGTPGKQALNASMCRFLCGSGLT